MPAIGSSSAICSGVSMFSRSSAPPVISTRWLDTRPPHWRGSRRSSTQSSSRALTSLTPCGTAGARAALPADRGGSGRAARGPGIRAVRRIPQPAARARSPYHLFRRAARPVWPAGRSFLEHYPARLPRAIWSTASSRWCCFSLARRRARRSTYRDPEFKTEMLGPEMVETIERREMWTHSIVAMKPLASSADHDEQHQRVADGVCHRHHRRPRHGLHARASTAFLIGVIGMACALAGMSVPLWSFVAPHGALELPAIFIAGGAGLRLGQGVLFPGFLPRTARGRSRRRRGAEAGAGLRADPGRRGRHRSVRVADRSGRAAEVRAGAALFVLLARI